MPVATPRVGEIWACTLTPVQTPALVASSIGNNVVFVGLTGVRVPMLWRDGLPWVKQGEPPFGQACSREGCRRDAFLGYGRPPRNVQEVVCPYHLPRGTECEILSHPNIHAPFFSGDQCEQCNVDAIEVFPEIPPPEFERLGVWTCQQCGRWWMRVRWEGHEFSESTAASLVPPGYRFVRYRLEHADQQSRRAFYWVQLSHDPTHVFQGLPVRNMFDYLLQDDELSL